MAQSLITVQSTAKRPKGHRESDGDPVAFWEQDDRHPHGQAWVAGPGEVEVYPTAAVLQAIGDKRIKQVGGREVTEEPEEDAPAAEETEEIRVPVRRGRGR